MRMGKLIAIFSIGFFFISCATDQSYRKTTEDKLVVQIEHPKDDKMAEKLRALESSISSLRTEVERLKLLESSIPTLHSGVENLRHQLQSIHTRPPLATYKLPRDVFLCGERISIEDRKIWENLDREFLAALGNEAQILLWIKRARRYFPYIEKKLKEMGLPDDLKYVTITESSLRPEAVSSSGAAGIWQFISSTGERYRMRRNSGIDERFDFFKATEGALLYLKGLYDEFKSWALAMAAYNAGENRIRKEIELQKTRDYFTLDLPMETERYVYKIAVAKIILSDLEKFGFYLEKEELYDPLEVERVQVEVPQPLPIIEVARAVGIFYKEIKEMNLHFSAETIPAGIHFLNLPPGTSNQFWSFFATWKKGLGRK